jgi:hypothetical protein
MEATGQPQDPAALHPGEQLPLLVLQEAVWAPEPVWTLWWREKFSFLITNRTPSPRSCSSQANHYTKWAIPAHRHTSDWSDYVTEIYADSSYKNFLSNLLYYLNFFHLALPEFSTGFKIASYVWSLSYNTICTHAQKHTDASKHIQSWNFNRAFQVGEQNKKFSLIIPKRIMNYERSEKSVSHQICYPVVVQTGETSYLNMPMFQERLLPPMCSCMYAYIRLHNPTYLYRYILWRICSEHC